VNFALIYIKCVQLKEKFNTKATNDKNILV